MKLLYSLNSRVYVFINLCLALLLLAESCTYRNVQTRNQNISNPSILEIEILAQENPVINQGIPNIGNSCYMNAVVEILASFYYKEFIKKEEVLGKTAKGLIESIRNKTANQAILRSQAKDLVEAINQYTNNKYKFSKQHDAPSLMFDMLEYLKVPSLELQIKRLNRITNTESFKKAYDRSLKIMKETSIPIKEHSMQEMLDMYFSPKTNENTISNSLLNKLNKKYNQPLIIYIPLLNPKLKNKPITKPMICIIKKEYTVKKDADTYYSLVGFIQHIGSSNNSGHYKAYVKVYNQWIMYNDSIVDIISDALAEEAANTSLLLFYKPLKPQTHP